MPNIEAALLAAVAGMVLVRQETVSQMVSRARKHPVGSLVLAAAAGAIAWHWFGDQ